MEQESGYNFSSMSEDKPPDPMEIENKTEPFPIVKFIIMIIAGFIGIFVSPSILAPIGLISGSMVMGTIFVSLAFAGVSGFLGERMIKKGKKIGWIGIVFVSIAILMILVPVLFVFIAPI